MPDAIVVGGGVMGLAVARELARGGRQVTLLERAQPGRAASWASAGIIGATTRDESDPGYHLRALSRQLWPKLAQALTEESGLDPEYREMGCLYLATDEAELSWLQRLANRATDGPEQTRFVDRRALRTEEPSLGEGILGALSVSGGNVEPRRLCRALEIAIRRAGVEVCSGVEVLEVTQSSGRVTGVVTRDGQLEADLVVLAAGAWSGALRGVEPGVPVRPQRGQILALDQAQVAVRHVLMTAGDPYFVPRCDGRLVVGATREEAGWDASLTASGIAWLLNRAMQMVPALADCPIAEMWTGFRPMSEDGVPIIGPASIDGLYWLTGHGPSGISPMPGSVALLVALIEATTPPLPPEPFSPSRFGQIS